ncbi:hypothetical protein FA10DRAFT_297928 [Acaromyces ingoldii]|uniref:Uncharacterized protein n=1 Tax=Acaromyces ingoldii TaxID=215250 RepID=A0A316YB89_9BASI|nr:hypothetical protein FA10DRAFT_297928 [Acaromyces ingoldii]PWN86846.1 hypothetical protein FA10DRAFT_297928 [Acaromyces ingoldii]
MSASLSPDARGLASALPALEQGPSSAEQPSESSHVMETNPSSVDDDGINDNVVNDDHDKSSENTMSDSGNADDGKSSAADTSGNDDRIMTTNTNDNDSSIVVNNNDNDDSSGSILATNANGNGSDGVVTTNGTDNSSGGVVNTFDNDGSGLSCLLPGRLNVEGTALLVAVLSCNDDLRDARSTLEFLQNHRTSLLRQAAHATEEQNAANQECARLWEEKLASITVHRRAEDDYLRKADEYHRAERGRIELCYKRYRLALEECLRHSHECLRLDEQHRNAEAKCNNINNHRQYLEQQRFRNEQAIESAEEHVEAAVEAHGLAHARLVEHAARI